MAQGAQSEPAGPGTRPPEPSLRRESSDAPTALERDEPAKHAELLTTLLAELPDAVVVAAASGTIVRANAEAARLFGIDVGAGGASSEAHGRGDETARRLLEHEGPLERSLRGEAVSERVTLALADGSRSVLDVSAAPIRSGDGEIAYAVAVCREATVVSRREQADRDFLTNAAHELQTPLAAIMSASEVLEAGAKEDAEDRDRFLGHIRRECDRLVRLVQALLTLARAQTEGEKPPALRIVLRSMLDEIALSLYPAPDVEVRVVCPARLAVDANPFLLEQAIGGLARNATKYTPSGRIWLRAAKDGGRGLRIEVADEGTGLPRDDAEILFERFYRGEPRDASGFGLGLPIVREAVRALGGEVELRPRNPNGTCATIFLPERASP